MAIGTTPLSGPVGNDTENAPLKRSLSLTLLVLYGLGVTIGAGIYVLIGSGRRRGCPRRPPTPPDVRFRIRRFMMRD